MPDRQPDRRPDRQPDRQPEPHGRATRVALIGAPNSGKTSLFNALTGANQRVGNYSGVTVERKEGQTTTPGGHALDHRPAGHAFAAGAQPRRRGDPRHRARHPRRHRAPDLLLVVADATHLRPGCGSRRSSAGSASRCWWWST
ncbi:MAG: FeoB small GTPase domain-containing protein [Paracoccaceae bacterium]